MQKAKATGEFIISQRLESSTYRLCLTSAAEEESDEGSEGPPPDDSKSQKSDEFESDGSLEELLATAQPGKLALRLQAEVSTTPWTYHSTEMECFTSGLTFLWSTQMWIW